MVKNFVLFFIFERLNALKALGGKKSSRCEINGNISKLFFRRNPKRVCNGEKFVTFLIFVLSLAEKKESLDIKF